ncbi:MAG: phage tail tape measure protein [Desulfuromonadales bacterium]|nr:phage tail tape measure protein [Desulfuromonadales bacterium]
MTNQKVKVEISADASDFQKGVKVSLQELGNLGRGYERLRKSQNKVSAARDLLDVRPHRQIRREIDQLSAAYNRLKRSGQLSARELYRAQLQLQRKTAELKHDTNGWADSIASARAGLAALAVVGYGVVRGMAGYSDFAQRMAEVSTLTDTSAESMAALSREVINLSRNVPQTASQLAAAQYDILSAGVSLERSVGVLELSSKAAVAGVTDTKTAVNAGLGVLNAYGLQVGELGDVYDALFTTVKLGVTTFPELSQHIGDTLPTAKAAGVGYREVAAAVAALTKAGIRTPQATTAMKGAINALAAPTAEARKQMQALGIEWRGLLPTLEQIAAQSLSIDQMRMLIPDVEARTGVLALTQNIEGLRQILGEMDTAGGAMQDAYDKMADTPQNQLQLLKNEASALALTLAGVVSKGLLPAIKGINIFLKLINEADPVTKALVATLFSAGAAFTLWHLGLGKIVFGLRGAGLAMLESRQQMLAWISTTKGAALAMRGLTAAVAIWAAIKLTQAVVEYVKMREAIEEAEAAQERLFETTGRVKDKFAEFRDVEIPADLTGKTQEDLQALRADLSRARAYWVAQLSEISEKARQTNWLGNPTEEAREAQKQLAETERKADGYIAAIGRVNQALNGQGEKTATVGRIGQEVYEDLAEEAKKSYEAQTRAAEKWAGRVIDLDEQIRQQRQSTEDKLRALAQKGMTDRQRYQDDQALGSEKTRAAEAELAAAQTAYVGAQAKRTEAQRLMVEMQAALASGDAKAVAKARAAAQEATRQAEQATAATEQHFGRAQELARQAEQTYGELAREVRDGDTVVISLQQGVQAARTGVEEVGALQARILAAQRDQAAGFAATAMEAAGQAGQAFESLSQQSLEVTIETPNLDQIRSQLQELAKPVTKEVRIKTVEARAAGGPAGGYVRMSRGGRLPGPDSKEDKIPVLARPGEWFIRNEAVSVWSRALGSGFMHAINAPWSGAGQKLLAGLQGVKMPAMSAPRVSVPNVAPLRFATGGAVPSGAGTVSMGTINLAIGGDSVAVSAPVSDLDRLNQLIRRARRTS